MAKEEERKESRRQEGEKDEEELGRGGKEGQRWKRLR